MVTDLVVLLAGQVIGQDIAHDLVVAPVDQILELSVLVFNRQHVVARVQLPNRQLRLPREQLAPDVYAVDVILGVVLALKEITLIQIPHPLLSLRTG